MFHNMSIARHMKHIVETSLCISMFSRLIHPKPVMLHRTLPKEFMNITFITIALPYITNIDPSSNNDIISLVHFFNDYRPIMRAQRYIKYNYRVNISSLQSQLLKQT